jgi:hypothetical protein
MREATNIFYLQILFAFVKFNNVDFNLKNKTGYTHLFCYQTIDTGIRN